MADQTPAGQESWDRIAHRAIQGPLAKIIAGLETVEHDAKSTLTPAARQSVRVSITTARRLMDMFESLLAVELLNTGAATIGDAPVHVGIALEPAVRALESRAKAAEITFSWTTREVALAVAGDEELLRRAVRLVGERVLDDVPKGGSLRMSAATDGHAVRLRITGSAPTEATGAFSVTEPVEIGFARLAVERMGGKVTCVRTPDSGSMIDLVLPVPGAHPAPAPMPAVSAPAAPAPAPVAAAPVSLPSPSVQVPTVVTPSPAIPLEVPGIPVPGAAGSQVHFDAAPMRPSDRPAPEAAPAAASQHESEAPAEAPPEKRDAAAAPTLTGMTITAPRTGGGKKSGEPGPAPHLAVSSALPPGTERADPAAPSEPEEAPKAGGLKITRHVDFDLMKQE